MVFPSLTDTFGLVMLEANACGTPVAGYPVTGPIDVISQGKNGFYAEDLKAAVEKAETINSEDCVSFANQFSWDQVTTDFINTLVRI